MTESSGTLLGHGKEGLPLDHFSMNKFVSANDNNYKSVRRQILDMNENGRALAEALRSGESTLGELEVLFKNRGI